MLRRRFTAALLGGAGAALAAPVVRAQTAGAPPATVLLVPFGGAPDAALREVEAGLRAGMGADVVRCDPIALPDPTWRLPHARYDPERLFERARPLVRPPVTRFLALLGGDTATATSRCDWPLGDVDRLGGVLSLARCQTDPPSEERVRFRVVTGALHALGHTLGLPHCADTACLMTAAHGLARAIDRTSGRFCAVCRSRLGLPPRAG
ncbi:MAG: hypothetical protein EPO40_02555 [Myxococcaceae bacterium]|nr:MAG: hypothetical protein EPO40_02555 [Myxococcaceae bacterium]